jgi:hypothetical protein
MNAKRTPLSLVVTDRALHVRVIRALKARGQKLAVDRLGDGHVVIDVKQQKILKRVPNLIELAHELELIKPWERPA